MIGEICESEAAEKGDYIQIRVNLWNEHKTAAANVEKTVIENMLDKYGGDHEEVDEKRAKSLKTTWHAFCIR